MREPITIKAKNVIGSKLPITINFTPTKTTMPKPTCKTKVDNVTKIPLIPSNLIDAHIIFLSALSSVLNFSPLIPKPLMILIPSRYS